MKLVTCSAAAERRRAAPATAGDLITYAMTVSNRGDSQADAEGRWTVPVKPKGLRYGAHRLEAKVKFAASSSTAAKTLRLGFGRCRPAVRKPTFTG